MDLQLAGKVALVTGSSGGIGAAIAEGLAKERTKVILSGRSEKKLQTTAERIEKSAPGVELECFAGDLAEEKTSAALVERYPQVDILVNNLGIFEPKPFVDIPDEDWRKFFEVNVLTGVRLSRQYLPKMLQKNWGRIVFISSESGVQIPAEMIHYGVTKTAMLAVSRGLAELTAGSGVTVNSVLPGPTASEGLTTFVNQTAAERKQTYEQVEAEFFQSVRPSNLLKRFETPAEVANMVVYVCSPLASGTNGSSLRVDGGTVRSII